VSAPLVPITNKRMLRTIRGTRTRAECWGAETTDGVWVFERIEDDGTPWLVVHRESGETVLWCSSLRNCRRAVAEGWAKAPAQAKAS
jgi:hypothetical protein